ncbi:exodeoxyribonuclease V subunit gamma [Azohydromonas caseinilytica]|uniref:RecBCD enzyme subunit RecC n=1 Tax=Azohydromonas caseinilytica TaxID=2728836 RepID=A0A848F9N5_9BURK|nr:exodeoxyribonuclease V subunit gamma [Azohydromonas caseinilytica]NML14940.1 exodeoxyribonuclease V subunit gamma [Azohydromonas caseinilytica]
MLSLCFSNRFQALQDSLLQALEADTGGVFEPVHVVVPSSAVRRTLSLAVARAQGVCANVAFSFLAEWLWTQSARLLPGAPGLAPFAEPVLAWRLFGLLGDAEFVAAQPRLQGYLDHADELMRWELAQRCAALFEQYLTYRGDWLAAWSEGRPADIEADAPDEPWQAALWRRLREELDISARHPVEPLLHALERLDDDALHAAGLPRCVHVFALPSVAPVYISVLQALSRRIDVRLYVLNPCREYWFEVVDSRRIARLEQQGRALYHEVGQRLLAAWGRQTQAHLDLLLEAATEAEIDDSAFIPHGAPTLLGRLQDAVLEMRELDPGSVALAPDDHSIELHVAHSRTRELEVLHDRLLALFAADDTLQPGDILVVTPDLNAAAPLVEAVFGTAPAERFIPWTLTGRARSGVNAPARALLSALALVGSRFTALNVFELLQQPPVARRFHLDAAALAQVQAWLGDAAIRWGLDGGRHSFGEGLTRLYLGYALPSEISEPFGERLPAGDGEGGDAQALGTFWRFTSVLRRLDERLSRPMAPDAWRGALLDAAEALIDPDAAELEDWRELQLALAALHEQLLTAGLEQPLSLPLIRNALQAQLDAGAPGGVPTGQLTFTSMGSLRNLPFRVVCAFGLDDGVFPSPQRPAEFDLMALAPRRGDRQRRQDERNLFLDLLLSARDRLLLSHTGRSVRDNAPLPPSVLVAELLDVLVPAIATDASPAALAAARARLVVEHPLQPFSLEAFDPAADPRKRSFNAEMARALRRALTGPAVPPGLVSAPSPDGADEDAPAAESASAFFSAPLTPPSEEERQVTLEQLSRFFRNPCRYLLSQRLGLELPRPGPALAEDEDFLPDRAGRRALAQRLLPVLERGGDESALLRLAQAGTEYPSGRLGRLLLQRELTALSGYAGALRGEEPLPPWSCTLEIDLDGEAWSVAGACADLRPEGLLRGRYGDAGAQDFIEAWLLQLWLCASRPEGVALRTRWQARDGQFEFGEAEQPLRTLAGLLRLYREGLTRPLHFFPRAAWAFIEGKELMSKAQAAWYGGPQWEGEGADPAYRLALRGCTEPLDAEFVRSARAVFGPLRRCLRGERA